MGANAKQEREWVWCTWCNETRTRGLWIPEPYVCGPCQAPVMLLGAVSFRALLTNATAETPHLDALRKELGWRDWWLR